MIVHVKPATRKRFEPLGLSRDVKEWQVDGITQALAEAEKPDVVFIDHAEVLVKWELKKGAC